MLNITFPYRPNSLSPSGFSDRRQKEQAEKMKKQRTDYKSMWFDIVSEITKKPIS